MEYENERLNEFEQYIKSKKVAIIGLGTSNIPLIDYFYEKKAEVTVFDEREIGEIAKNIIDKVGGVTVNIDEDELAFINNNSKVKLEHSGDVVLNGEQALIHSRNRTVGNDFSRAERQRNILVSLIQKIYSMESDEILSLSIYFLSQVKTNVTDYVDYGNSIISDKKEYLNNIISVQIPSTEYSEGKYIDGIYYFTTDLEKAKQDMYKYLYEQ